jgi:hypothetical protein
MKRYVTEVAVLALLIAAAPTGRGAPVKEVSIWVARDVAPGPKVRLTINTRNVPVVRMSAYPLHDIRVLINRAELKKRPATVGRPARTWTVAVAKPEEKINPAQGDAYRSRRVNLPELEPGIYLLTAEGGDKEAWAPVNVTHLAVVVKRSPRQMLTWVTDATNGALVRGAAVTLYQKSWKEVKSATTRDDGTCIFDVRPGSDETVVVSKGSDLAAVPTGIEAADGQLMVHFQTDRPIYRPGQTVFYKAILRRTKGRGYVPVANTGCTVEIRDSKDSVLIETKATTNHLGTLADQAEIPSEGVIGPYTIVVNVGKESAYETFTVAEYRKPEFKVSVSPDRKRYLSGEDIAFEVQANYYFGAPVPQAAVRYQVRRSDTPYWSYDGANLWVASSDGNLYPRDTYRFRSFVAEGTVYTDENGKVTIPLKTEKDAPDSSYTIQCTVQDASRRQVEAFGSVPVYAAAVRLGMRTDVLFVPLGAVIPLTLSAVDLDGKPTAAKVALTVMRPIWDEKTEGEFQYKVLSRTVVLSRTEVMIPSSGKASAKVPAKAEGDLIITAAAVDATGRKSSAELSIWVADASAKVGRETREPMLWIKLDRRNYTPGDTVKAWVRTNTGGRPILLTVEGREIWRYSVVTGEKKAFSWSLKTDVEMSPTIYLEAAQWNRNWLVTGSAVIRIPDPARRLAVRIEPEKTAYKPGETASYVVSSTGPSGEPIPAEVAVAVVDESIYALQPDTTADLYGMFWGARPNLVLTGCSAPEELSGGAYQRVNAVAPVRQRFVDTAYWNARVQTGPDGRAKINLEIPGNLTTWRATARAVTSDTMVGVGTASVQVSRPVMLRLAAPRQLVQGDRLKLIGTVNNRTDAPHEFEVMIGAERLAVEAETVKRVKVAAGGEGTLQWEIFAKDLPEDGQASVTGRVIATDAPADRGEEFSDALKISITIVPKGVQQRLAAGGALAREKTVTLRLPSDRIEPASVVTVALHSGLGQVVDDRAEEVANAGRWSSSNAADQLLVAHILPKEESPKVVTESLAALSRYQQETGGWGWWNNDRTDPVVTAQVLLALARADLPRSRAREGLADRGVSAAIDEFDHTNLWEHRAILAASAKMAFRGRASTSEEAAEQAKKLSDMLDEVERRGTSLSPYAQLLLAEALVRSGGKDSAAAITKAALKDALVGPETAYAPGGDHPGWSATTVETTAQALITLMALSQDAELQPKLAQWLASPEEDAWLSTDESAATAYALHQYLREHPSPGRPGTVEVLVNGSKVEYKAVEDRPIRVTVPRSFLKDGDNSFALRRTGSGEVFFSVDARVFRPATAESSTGMRVLRRYDVRNSAGLWDEMRGPVKPSDPLRCTVLVWPDDRSEGIRMVEPIPAGFEFVDSDYTGAGGREEVRDGAVLHYLRAYGRPVYFRYYLRSESEGTVTALPASAEVLRRPSVRGNTPSTELDVAD